MRNLFLLLAFVLAFFSCVGAEAIDRSFDKYTLTSGDAKKFKSDGQIVYNSTSVGKSGWVMYKQCDSRWAGQQLGYCSETICSAGCAMTSVAMMLKTKGAGVDPAYLDSYLTTHGGYSNGCDIIWGRADDFGVTQFRSVQWCNYDEICGGLSKNHGLIANVRNGGHWVLLTGCAGNGNVYVNDPGFNQNTYNVNEIGAIAVYW
jgi:hypothetical protein